MIELVVRILFGQEVLLCDYLKKVEKLAKLLLAIFVENY
jgi:hypothetical protein